MRFTVQREAFLKPLRAVAGVVEKRHSQMSPILSHVLISVENNHFTLTTTDQEVELLAKGEFEEVQETGAITVPFRKLMDLCRTLPEGISLNIIQEKERLIVRAGRSRFALSTLPKEEFPNIDPNLEGTELFINKKNLRNLIDNTSFAMAEQDVRLYLNGMLLEVKEGNLYAAASDGHRLALSSTPIGVGKQINPLRIIVPRKGILELQRILDENDEEIKLIITNNQIQSITENISLTSKLLDGRFPEYERIIPTQGDKIIFALREALKQAFIRASALFSDKFRGVRLQLSTGKLKIQATNSELDEVEEDLEVDYQGEDLEIGFNVKYLIDFLTVIPTETVRFTFSDANNSARVEGVDEGGGIYIIMPMRI